MSRRTDSHRSPHGENSGDALADHYLSRDGGLSFDFDTYRAAAGGSGNDRIGQSPVNDYLWGRAGADQLGGGMGKDVVYGDAGNDLVSGNADADLLYGGMGNDKLYGGMLGDTLRGEEGNDWLDEGAGHGDLEGGWGTIRWSAGEARMHSPLTARAAMMSSRTLPPGQACSITSRLSACAGKT
jgi:serralysin